MATPFDIVMSVYLGIVLILILAVNCLVIGAFVFGSRKMKTFTNYFIVNLAVSDLLVGFLSIPYWIYIKSLPAKDATKELSVYKIFEWLDVMFGVASILSLVALTFERLVAVKFPAWHFNLTWKPVVGVLSLTWVLGAALSGLRWLTPKYLNNKKYFYILFSLAFVLPTILIVGSYTVIFYVAKKSETFSSKRVKKDVKIARMILIIIGLFLFCWLPFFALGITYYNCHSWCKKIPNELVQIAKSLHYTNSMMNFLVYAVRSQDYRRSFSALIRWKIPRLRSDTMTSHYMARRRTMSNRSTTNEKANDNLVGNDTLSTPLPERAHKH